MISGPDLTIALTVANISLMMTQITSRGYMLQNDFKLIIHSPKHTKISKKKNYKNFIGQVSLNYK